MTVDLHLWERDASLHPLREILNRTPPLFQVICFDFFDTLVSRLTPEPANLFIEVGRRLASSNLLLTPLSPAEFYYARIAADERARRFAVSQGRSSEVTIKEIYKELERVVSNLESALLTEKETEQALCYVNPNLASLVQYVRSLGYKTAIISDTCLSSSDLADILLANGLDPALFDKIIVSCENDSSKWEGGRLFLKALAMFDLDGKELLHIGDNFSSDIQLSAVHGISGLHYERSSPYQDEILKAEKNLGPASTSHALSLDSVRILASRHRNTPNECFIDGAFIFGPVLARFADWSLEVFSRAKVRKVLALMREGDILGELLRNSASAHNKDLCVLPCYVSRKSTALAALSQDISADTICELLVGGPPLSIRHALSIIGIGKEADQFLPESTLSQKIETSEVLHSLIRMIVDGKALRSIVAAKAAEKQTLAFDYLSPLVGEDECIGVLDLGWSGSMQRNISRILSAGGKQVKTVGCYLATTNRAACLALQGQEIHGFLDNWNCSTIVLEVPILAPIGSTEEYVRDAEGKTTPVLTPYHIDDGELWSKKRLREGILSFQEKWLKIKIAKGPRVFSESALAQIDSHNSQIIRRLTDYPTHQEATRLGALHHDENYGVTCSRQLCDSESEALFKAQGIQGLFQRGHCYWPQAVVARESPRLISGLSQKWDMPFVFGQLGGRASFEGKLSSLTEEEYRLLIHSLQDSRFDQVIFFGPGLAGDVLFLNSLPINGNYRGISRGGDSYQGNGYLNIEQMHKEGSSLLGHHPRNGEFPSIIEIRTEASNGAWPECGREDRYVWLSGKPEEGNTLKKISNLLIPQSSCLLILTEGMQMESVVSVLLFLPAFLGQGSMIAGNHGRLDTVTLFTQQNIRTFMLAWSGKYGKENGYSLAEFASNDRNLQLTWTFLIKR